MKHTRRFWVLCALVVAAFSLPAIAAHVSRTRYEALTIKIGKDPIGAYWDKTNNRMVGVDSAGTVYEVPLQIASQARGDIISRGANTWDRMAAGTSGSFLVGNGTDVTSTAPTASLVFNALETGRNSMQSDHTRINFLKEGWQPIFAKTTRAVVTEIDTQEDFFHTRNGNYFEYFQDGTVATSVTGWSPSTAGWVFPGDDEADTGWQLTEGILLGPARSFVVGTDAFYIQVAFYLPKIDQHAEIFAGFRVLEGYAVADDATELKTAYNRKALIGIEGAAAALVGYTSIDAGTDVGPTTCTGTDPVDGDVIVLKLAVSAAGVTTMSYGKAAAAGATYAQITAALATAEAALASDALCNAVAVTLNAATVVVPTIMFASANGTGANTSTIVSYYAGMQ